MCGGSGNETSPSPPLQYTRLIFFKYLMTLHCGILERRLLAGNKERGRGYSSSDSSRLAAEPPGKRVNDRKNHHGDPTKLPPTSRRGNGYHA